MEIVTGPLEQEGSGGCWLFHLCRFLALETMHESGVDDKGIIDIHLLCVQLGNILLENEREGCIGGKGQILHRELYVYRSTKQSFEEYEGMGAPSDL